MNEWMNEWMNTNNLPPANFLFYLFIYCVWCYFLDYQLQVIYGLIFMLYPCKHYFFRNGDQYNKLYMLNTDLRWSCIVSIRVCVCQEKCTYPGLLVSNACDLIAAAVSELSASASSSRVSLSAQLSSAQLNSTQLSSTQLNSAQLNSTQLNSTCLFHQDLLKYLFILFLNILFTIEALTAAYLSIATGPQVESKTASYLSTAAGPQVECETASQAVLFTSNWSP